MPTTRTPRHGSMQYWPRKRAGRAYPRIKSWAGSKEAGLLGFAGYKIGMTTVFYNDTRKHSKTKGKEVAFPATIIECPPLKIASIRLYKKDTYGLKLKAEIYGDVDKELGRKIPLPKKADPKKLDSINPEEYFDIRVNAYTQPKKSFVGKKKPELFEVGLGGTPEEKLAFAKENLGKEIPASEVFKPGEQLDVHAVSTGRGFQGPVKRFGIGLTSHKAEKARRNPGSLGGWKGQGHFMYRIAHAGQTGYHTRTEHNKWLLKIGDKPEDINPKGGFVGAGEVKSSYLLVKGSIQGPARRLVRLCHAARPNPKVPSEEPQLTYISKESKQK